MSIKFKKVALIVGHSQTSQGAKNKDMGLTEFVVNDFLVKQIAVALEDHTVDCEIVYRDSTYSKLPAKVNDTKADFAISFHCNAFNTLASGCEMLYYHSSEKGRIMAGILQKKVQSVLRNKDRGIKAKHSEDRGGFLLRETFMPCVVSEAFFIDNTDDMHSTIRNREVLVQAFVEAILEIADYI